MIEMPALAEPVSLMSPPIANPFQAIQTLVAGDEFLCPVVMDMQIDDDTLVVMITPEVPATFVEAIIQPNWPGDLEVFCATDLMVGVQRTN